MNSETGKTFVIPFTTIEYEGKTYEITVQGERIMRLGQPDWAWRFSLDGEQIRILEFRFGPNSRFGRQGDLMVFFTRPDLSEQLPAILTDVQSSFKDTEAVYLPCVFQGLGQKQFQAQHINGPVFLVFFQQEIEPDSFTNEPQTEQLRVIIDIDKKTAYYSNIVVRG